MKIKDMKFKVLTGIVILGSLFLLISCNNAFQKNSIHSEYVGSWEMEIKELPKVGDVHFIMNLQEKDFSLSGIIIEEDGDTVRLNKIIIEDEYLNIKYNWADNDVGFKIKKVDKDIIEGSFMRLYDVFGKKI